MSKSSDIAVVSKSDFVSVSKKLTSFIQELQPNEREIMAWMMSLAGWSPSLHLHPHYKPRGAKFLVLGGADGLTVLFGRTGMKVIPPEGPLPTDFLGASFVPGENAIGTG